MKYIISFWNQIFMLHNFLLDINLFIIYVLKLQYTHYKFKTSYIDSEKRTIIDSIAEKVENII